MKNRRGFLLAEETLKIIIALISITFLVYFLSALYLSNKTNQDIEFAKSSLKHLVDEINAGSTEIEIYNPASSDKFPGGWILISFPLSNNIYPNQCENQACICICEEAANTLTNDGLRTDCDNSGTCLKSDLKSDKIKLENPPITLSINNKEISRK